MESQEAKHALNSGGVVYATVPQTLSEVNGLVIRQKTQKGEVVAQMLGIPFEAKNKYKVGLLPTNKVVKSAPNDPDGWEPTAEELEQLDTFLFAREQSSCMARVCTMFLGCGNLRPLTMHFSVAGSTGDVYVIQRPFLLGGCCCCPLEMNLDMVAEGQAQRMGRVREDFSPYFSKCLAGCCLATTYTDIERAMPDGTYEKKYSLRSNLSCCGRVNNCCGATCFKNDAVYDILDTKGEIVAHLQRTYAKGSSCMGACCRMGFDFSNYILEFPRDSTPEDRMLLLTAVFQVEYQIFERSGSE
uniref:Phospholipid scramblase n=1 Tax=Globisporangium ultimum (strain ATCC 200006 / CBS 805.95 / DAOM BR144) TaxID=431595 RepID=K3WVW8_GLOUD